MKYLIQQKHKPLNIIQFDRNYTVVFDKAIMARTVLNRLHPIDKPILTRGDPILISRDELWFNMDVDSTLFIKKSNGDPLHALNDGGFHVETINDKVIFNTVFNKNTGLVFPYNLITEDDEEFVYKCQVIELFSGKFMMP